MHRSLLLLMLAVVISGSAYAQESTDQSGDEPDPATTESESAAEPEPVEAAEEPVVDDEYYQDVDDKDFRPSEDVPADQSIPFPSDI